MIQLSKRVAALTIYTGNVSFGKLETFESAHTEYCMNPIPVSFSKAIVKQGVGMGSCHLARPCSCITDMLHYTHRRVFYKTNYSHIMSLYIHLYTCTNKL